MKKSLLMCLFLFNNLQSKPSMIIGLPRSGSTFFARMISRALEGKYTAEFEKAKTDKTPFIMGNGFYGEHSINFWNIAPYNMFEELSEEYFEQLWNEWGKSGLSSTKEVTAYTNIPFYHEKYDMVAVYRHRRHTFPSSNAAFFDGIYRSFLQAHLKDKKLQALQKSFETYNAVHEIQRIAGGYVIAAYVMLDKCLELNIPIIEYHKYIGLAGDARAVYLKEKLPQSLYSEKLLNLLDEYAYQRKGTPAGWLEERENNYQQSKTEKWIQHFFEIIKDIDPEFKGWNYLA